MALIRLDRLISNRLCITRSEAKEKIKKGQIMVNGETQRSADIKIDPALDTVLCDNQPIQCKQYIYILLNKPKGVVCATRDDAQTVLDILPEKLRRKDLFPVGRLDKDTTGLLLITNDGQFAHQVISPKKQIHKTYIATLSSPLPDAGAAAIRSGIKLADSTKALPAFLKPLNADQTQFEIRITEGKYHQVRRMFAAAGSHVADLKRIAIGALRLDTSLPEGSALELSFDEAQACLCNADNSFP